MSATRTARRAGVVARSDPALTLVAVCAGMFMLLLDLTIVYVALPNVKASLGASLTELQWVVDAYALALAAVLLAAGGLADIVGRRRVFCAGLVLFALASLACGLMRSPAGLIASRTVQGVGAAMMFSTAIALVGLTFEGAARAKAFGVLGAVTAVAGALGPLVGGLLTETIGWPAIFFVNVPLGVCALALALRGIAESRRADAPRVDWLGAALLSATLGMLVLALLRGNDEGWTSAPILALFAGAAACSAAFPLVELRRRDPLLDLALFRRRTFLGVSLAAFAQAVSLFALLLYIVLYLQNVRGYSPLGCGLALLPISLAALPPGLGAPWLAARVPLRMLLAGGLLSIAAGLALLTQVATDTAWEALLPGLLFVGAGLGVLNPPLGAAAIDVVPDGRAGLGSGINATFRQVGIAIGVALYGAIFEHRVSAAVPRRLEGTTLHDYAGRISRAVVAGGQGESIAAAPPRWRPLVREVATHTYVSGLRGIVSLAAVVAALSALGVMTLVRSADLRSPRREPPP